MLENIDIYDKFTELGLKKRSTSVYLALLKLGETTANQIAKEAGVERTTVYNILKELGNKQLLTESRVGKRITYVAEPPEFLCQMLEGQLEIAKSILPFLLKVQGKTKERPIIRYYNNRDSILKAYKETLECKDKIHRNFAYVPFVEELLGNTFINRYTEDRIKNNIITKSLRVKFKNNELIHNWYLKDKNKDVRRETKYIDVPFITEGFIKIYDDVVLLIKLQSKPFMVMIKSSDIANMIKVLFDIIWEKASKIDN